MNLFNRKHDDADEFTYVKTYGIIRKGAQFPPQDSIERLAKYKRAKKWFDGKQRDVYERATAILKDSPFSSQARKTLYRDQPGGYPRYQACGSTCRRAGPF